MAKGKGDPQAAFKSSGYYTVYSLRRMSGGKARKPNRYARCIGAELRGNSYPKAPEGFGGRLDENIRDAFKKAVKKCKGAKAKKK